MLLKASGNFNQLSSEEKLALVLYDFILWDEGPGLDIKRADIAAAKSIFTLVTQNAALGEKLVGGFNDNASFEIFQFFNVEFNREGFHTFCLERWKELSSEWNALKLELLLERVKRDFHPNTYINNPVLKDYLDVYGGTAPKKESPAAAPPKEEAPSMVELTGFDFDLTEFDSEGRPIGMKKAPEETPKKEVEKPELDLNTFDLETFGLEEESAPKTPSPGAGKGKPADPSQVDEPDRCLDDHLPFLTSLLQLRFYYYVLSKDSKAFRASFEEILHEFTKAAVVHRISDKAVRQSHEGGNLGQLFREPLKKSWDIYDKDFDTHNDYTRSLGKVVSELVQHCNTGLFLDTLEFFLYLGDTLEEKDSPTGSLTPQDRYFPLYLMLKASPEQDPENLEMVLDKGAKSRNANNGCDVKALLLKASGNFDQLSNEEKLALVLYDFILWDEGPGLDIKKADIAAAKSIFALVTQNAALGEKLVGGFDDNATYEIFQFFNVEFNRKGFHAFCLERWKELSSEWNALKLQLLLDSVKRDFHPNTYTNNPVLKDYLEVYGGVKVGTLTAAPAPAKEEEETEEDESPYILDEKKKTLVITSMMHSILFVILHVGSKFDQFTKEEIADIQSTAVTLGEWFDLDQDECLEALDETLELLKKCKTIFNVEQMSAYVFLNCLGIYDHVSNKASREDITRFMNDLANADGKVTQEEQVNLDFYCNVIIHGSDFANNPEKYLF